MHFQSCQSHWSVSSGPACLPLVVEAPGPSTGTPRGCSRGPRPRPLVAGSDGGCCGRGGTWSLVQTVWGVTE